MAAFLAKTSWWEMRSAHSLLLYPGSQRTLTQGTATATRPSPCPAGSRMDRQQSEDPLEAAKHRSLSSLHTVSPIIGQVPALACSVTAHISPNSPFLLKQHNFRISLIIVSNTKTTFFAASFPSLPNTTTPTPNIPPPDLFTTPEGPPGSASSRDPSAPKSTLPRGALPGYPEYCSPHPSGPSQMLILLGTSSGY